MTQEIGKMPRIQRKVWKYFDKYKSGEMTQTQIALAAGVTYEYCSNLLTEWFIEYHTNKLKTVQAVTYEEQPQILTIADWDSLTEKQKEEWI